MSGFYVEMLITISNLPKTTKNYILALNVKFHPKGAIRSRSKESASHHINFWLEIIVCLLISLIFAWSSLEKIHFSKFWKNRFFDIFEMRCILKCFWHAGQRIFNFLWPKCQERLSLKVVVRILRRNAYYYIKFAKNY